MDDLNICLPLNDSQTNKYLWTIWNQHPNFSLDGQNNILKGWSWAALRTNFVVSKLMFDAGLSSPINSDYIFLTHGHSDHSASLYFHTLGNTQLGKKRIIYVSSAIYINQSRKTDI